MSNLIDFCSKRLDSLSVSNLIDFWSKRLDSLSVSNLRWYQTYGHDCKKSSSFNMLKIVQNLYYKTKDMGLPAFLRSYMYLILKVEKLKIKNKILIF